MCLSIPDYNTDGWEKVWSDDPRFFKKIIDIYIILKYLFKTYVLVIKEKSDYSGETWPSPP